MNMPLKKSETAIALPAGGAVAKVLALGAPRRPPLKERLRARASSVAASVIPPLIVVTLILLVWELVCSRPARRCRRPRAC